MVAKKGFTAHTVLIIVAIVAFWALVIYLGVSRGVFKKTGLPFAEKKPNVQLKTEYSNPFQKETQYVNPFDQYKNPFLTVSLRTQ